MTDREKVINDLQDAVNDDWMWQHADFYARTMEKAIQLLKEQDNMIPIKPAADFLAGYAVPPVLHMLKSKIPENSDLVASWAGFLRQFVDYKPDEIQVLDPGGICPKCKMPIYPEDHPHFCGYCGQAVKWKNRLENENEGIHHQS